MDHYFRILKAAVMLQRLTFTISLCQFVQLQATKVLVRLPLVVGSSMKENSWDTALYATSESVQLTPPFIFQSSFEFYKKKWLSKSNRGDRYRAIYCSIIGRDQSHGWWENGGKDRRQAKGEGKSSMVSFLPDNLITSFY